MFGFEELKIVKPIKININIIKKVIKLFLFTSLMIVIIK